MKTRYSLEQFELEMEGEKDKGGVIEPAFKENNIAITLVSSNEYAPFAAVVIASIIANTTQQYNYDIVLLTDNMYQRNAKKIEEMASEKKNVMIRIINISERIKDFSFYTWAHFTSNTYYRLFTPDIFKNYDKVIYLDSDIVVNHDIAELYMFDLTDCYMACAYDTHVVSYCTRKPPLEQRKYNVETLGLKNPEEYFQAGVSIFNTKKIHEDFETGYLITQATEHKLRWLDQDLINMLFQGHIQRLPNKWNVMVSNIPNNLDEYFLPENLKKEYYEARKDPYIIHYVGRSLPCYTTTPDLYEYFWKYAKLTVFYEILLQRMVVDYTEKIKQSFICEVQNGTICLKPGLKVRIKKFILSFFPYETKRYKLLSVIWLRIRKR